ncbi:hypothetical protein QQF64_034907 [Cirrhinus molitorella]|uniref:Uncharacterized protein n=1 Tax=Cirrhinus molitorella TaxID=172907 RepID=A0ABR3NEC5_9TELE
MEMLQDTRHSKNTPTGHFTHTDGQGTPAACVNNSDSCQSENSTTDHVHNTQTRTHSLQLARKILIQLTRLEIFNLIDAAKKPERDAIREQEKLTLS